MTKTIAEWNEILLPSEYEALTDMNHGSTPNDRLSPNEVLEAIVTWEGGIASAYHIISIISRVYGIELG